MLNLRRNYVFLVPINSTSRLRTPATGGALATRSSGPNIPLGIKFLKNPNFLRSPLEGETRIRQPRGFVVVTNKPLKIYCPHLELCRLLHHDPSSEFAGSALLSVRHLLHLGDQSQGRINVSNETPSLRRKIWLVQILVS